MRATRNTGPLVRPVPTSATGSIGSATILGVPQAGHANVIWGCSPPLAG
jgi:hypothetical protein